MNLKEKELLSLIQNFAVQRNRFIEFLNRIELSCDDYIIDSIEDVYLFILFLMHNKYKDIKISSVNLSHTDLKKVNALFLFFTTKQARISKDRDWVFTHPSMLLFRKQIILKEPR